MKKAITYSLQILLVAICFSLYSCEDEAIPKPKAFLRLQYPTPQYERVSPELPFTFDKNTLAAEVSAVKISRDGKVKGIDIVYPNLKGTIYLTYKEVTESNLRKLLLDAQNITQSHTVKADEIAGDIYENTENKVFGMFYEVGGNAASQSQFYVTDSINHFLNGSLYFYAKPNFDSILPAAHYLKNDIRKIMESVRWK